MLFIYLILLIVCPTLQQKSHLSIPEKDLRGFSPYFHIHVSVSDLQYIFPGSFQIFSFSRIGRPIVGIYKSLTDT
jgi:hypothetical protein